MYQEFQKTFQKRFDVKSGDVGVYLGNQIKVDHDKLTVELSQKDYINDMLQRFGMSDCRPVSTPLAKHLSSLQAGTKLTPKEHALYRNMIGSMLYLACWTRPDIAYAISELSRFVTEPADQHLQAAKHLLRYLKGTKDFGLKYSQPKDSSPQDQSNLLWGFVDSDWAGCPDTRRSTSGYVLMLNGAAISWKSKRQTFVALSTAEAEFIAASLMVQEVIYIRRLLDKLGYPQSKPTVIFEDNTTCIKWAEGAVGGTDRAKHIDLRKHFVHQAQQSNILLLKGIKGEDDVADLLTKR